MQSSLNSYAQPVSKLEALPNSQLDGLLYGAGRIDEVPRIKLSWDVDAPRHDASQFASPWSMAAKSSVITSVSFEDPCTLMTLKVFLQYCGTH